MSAHKIAVPNLFLIRITHYLFWRDSPFFRQSLREYPDSDLAKALYTIINFADCAFCLITGLCGRKNYFTFSFWFSETFSIMLFSNWSLITWSYALNVSRFCPSRFKSDFRRPRPQDLLLFKDTLFSVYTRPVSYQPTWIFYTHFHHDLSDSFPLPVHLYHTDGKNHLLMFL